MSSTLPYALHTVTEVKIREHTKLHAVLTAEVADVLRVADQEQDIGKRVKILFQALCRLSGDSKRTMFEKGKGQSTPEKMANEDDLDSISSPKLKNLYRFLFDPSASRWQMNRWEEYIRRRLSNLVDKSAHAILFSRLATEWLDELDSATKVEEGDNFEHVNRKEMLEQLEGWESHVFTTVATDGVAIQAYLSKTFLGNDFMKENMERLREDVKRFGEKLINSSVMTMTDIKASITRLTAENKLAGDKIKTLNQIGQNKLICQEVLDIVNMRIKAIDKWNWHNGLVDHEMRRGLNGRYRAFMDCEIFDAILLDYFGTMWSKFLTPKLKTLLTSIPRFEIPLIHRVKLRHCMKNIDPLQNIEHCRKATYEDSYLLAYLQEKGSGNNSGIVNSMSSKQKLLSLMLTEKAINMELYGQFSVVRTDFDWLNASMPHTSALEVLKFFGFPHEWLLFFLKVFKTPLRFVHEGKDYPVREKQSGLPSDLLLADVVRELILCCLDKSIIDQHSYLYRMQDDFWLWGNYKACVDGWDAMTEFARVMGLEFDKSKTGSATFGASEDFSLSLLPSGPVKWGLLVLDPAQGKFVADQAKVDLHVQELRRQLQNCRSVLKWIHAWNKYFVKFFPNHLGKASVCFGKQHVDMIVETLQRVELATFEGTEFESALDYLRKTIKSRFGFSDLPDGYFYFPLELGGLELGNPYVPLLTLRENLTSSDETILEQARSDISANYACGKQTFEADVQKFSASYWEKYPPEVTKYISFEEACQFIAFEEYIKYPEYSSREWSVAYKKLLTIPLQARANHTPEMNAMQAQLDEADKFIARRWTSMKPYWQWIAQSYGEEMENKFGGLAAVDKTNIPLGVVDTLRRSLFKWE